MESLLVEKLKLRMQPIGIHYSNKIPENAMEFPVNKRVCVVSMLLASTKGKTVAVNDDTCLCSGGAVGLCFGDAFVRRNHPTLELLSTGMKGDAGPMRSLSAHLQYGERFFDSPETAQKWKDALPIVEAPQEYAIFTPLSDWIENNPPELVHLFVNPDQLSVLVAMSGFFTGTLTNVVAPFTAACQSILMAHNEIGKKDPKMILGFFDISQRSHVPKELLTLTMPYSFFQMLEKGVAEGCLTTESWKQIQNRFDEYEEL